MTQKVLISSKANLLPMKGLHSVKSPSVSRRSRDFASGYSECEYQAAVPTEKTIEQSRRTYSKNIPVMYSSVSVSKTVKVSKNMSLLARKDSCNFMECASGTSGNKITLRKRARDSHPETVPKKIVKVEDCKTTVLKSAGASHQMSKRSLISKSGKSRSSKNIKKNETIKYKLVPEKSGCSSSNELNKSLNGHSQTSKTRAKKNETSKYNTVPQKLYSISSDHLYNKSPSAEPGITKTVNKKPVVKKEKLGDDVFQKPGDGSSYHPNQSVSSSLTDDSSDSDVQILDVKFDKSVMLGSSKNKMQMFIRSSSPNLNNLNIKGKSKENKLELHNYGRKCEEKPPQNILKSFYPSNDEVLINEADIAPTMPSASVTPDRAESTCNMLDQSTSFKWLSANGTASMSNFNNDSSSAKELHIKGTENHNTSPEVKVKTRRCARRELKLLYDNLNEISWAHEKSFKQLLTTNDYLRHTTTKKDAEANKRAKIIEIGPIKKPLQTVKKQQSPKLIKTLPLKKEQSQSPKKKQPLLVKKQQLVSEKKQLPISPKKQESVSVKKQLPLSPKKQQPLVLKKQSQNLKKQAHILKSKMHTAKRPQSLKKTETLKNKSPCNQVALKKVKLAKLKPKVGTKSVVHDKKLPLISEIKKENIDKKPILAKKVAALKKNAQPKGTAKNKQAVQLKANLQDIKPFIGPKASCSGFQNNMKKWSFDSTNKGRPSMMNHALKKLEKLKYSKELNFLPKAINNNNDFMSAYLKASQLKVTLQPLEHTNMWSADFYEDLRKEVLHQALLKTLEGTETDSINSMFKDLHHSLINPLNNIKLNKKKKPEEETLRSSVRQSEGAFRYKEIVVKKHPNYMQFVLVPNSCKHNSLSIEAMKELKDAFLLAKKEPNCRAVLINSSGSYFCTGIDLSLLVGANKKQVAEEMANTIRDLVMTLAVFTKPVIAAVNGIAVGFGVALLTFCDVVLASDKATFSIPATKIGYLPEGGVTLTLPQVVGAGVATEMLLQGRQLTAEQALRYGLVSEILWPTQLMNEVIPRIQTIISQPLQVLEATKSMVRCHLWEKLKAHVDREWQLLPTLWLDAQCQHNIKKILQSGWPVD